VGHVGVLDGQGGRCAGGRGARPRGRPTRVRRDRRTAACLEGGPPGGRGGPDRRAGVARDGAGRGRGAGDMLRHRVRRRVVRVRVRLLRGRVARPNVGDRCAARGGHVASAVHGQVFELGGRRVFRRRRGRWRRRGRRRRETTIGGRRAVARVPDGGVSGRPLRDGRERVVADPERRVARRGRHRGRGG